MSKTDSTLAADELTTDTVGPEKQDVTEEAGVEKTGVEKTDRDSIEPEADSSWRMRRIRTAILVVITVRRWSARRSSRGRRTRSGPSTRRPPRR